MLITRACEAVAILPHISMLPHTYMLHHTCMHHHSIPQHRLRRHCLRRHCLRRHCLRRHCLRRHLDCCTWCRCMCAWAITRWPESIPHGPSPSTPHRVHRFIQSHGHSSRRRLQSSAASTASPAYQQASPPQHARRTAASPLRKATYKVQPRPPLEPHAPRGCHHCSWRWWVTRQT